MTIRPHPWVIVLAGGDGTRLQSMTKNGVEQAIPKQFCALRGTRSMLQETLDRALQLAPAERILVVVAGQHQQWWESELKDHPPANVVVQPSNRGTAAGVLLPLLMIHARDPEAEIAIMPSDHFVSRKEVLCSAIDRALMEVDARPNRIVLLGVTPEAPDADFGWILPSSVKKAGVFRKVQSFVEKPDVETARNLMDSGGMINTFLLAARSRALLKLFRRRTEFLELFRTVVGRTHEAAGTNLLVQLYQSIETIDFSRALLQPSAGQGLWVFSVPACGWNDLGTPERVVACLRREHEPSSAARSGPRAALNLSRVLERDAWIRYVEMI